MDSGKDELGDYSREKYEVWARSYRVQT